ncbi:MAG TPA: hypothetical protein DEV81_06065 [Cyanobacteria bacterium UBA11049]|nr:hypothetical protein [Cyanobacteria bacterium UBA11049]
MELDAFVAPATLVLRGSVQARGDCSPLKERNFSSQQLASISFADWRKLRSGLKQHQTNQVKQLRFRRSPVDYLACLGIAVLLVNFAAVEKKPKTGQLHPQ